MSEIQYIISDLDGTVADTFEANYQAYKSVFGKYGFELTRESYRRCYGFKLDDLCRNLGFSSDTVLLQKIKEQKAACYPEFFSFLRPNMVLINFYRAFKRQGGHLALATTASRKNVLNILDCLQLGSLFDFIIVGEEVKRGKPDPECFLLALQRWGIGPEKVLVFEDSEIGIKAAEQAGLKVLGIRNGFYET